MMLSVVTSTKDTWQELNFAELQKSLESTVVELAANREKGDAARTSLVQLTRDFRKSASEETKKSVLTLLKNFQSEIDASRKRCQYAEDSYIALYKRLIDLPDPTLALMEAQNLQKKAAKVTDSECENRKLRELNEQLRTEVSELKHYESESVRLQKLLDEANNNLEMNLKSKVNQIEDSYNKLILDKEHELLVSRAEMEEKLRAMEEKTLGLTQALELAQSELFKLRTQADTSESGKTSELELLTDELDKARERIRDLEDRLSSIPAGWQADEDMSTNRITELSSRIEDLESDLSQKETEIATYISKLSDIRAEKDSIQTTLSAKVEELQSCIETLESQLSEASSRLQSQSDYEDVCRELAFLRSIEFSEENQLTERGEPEGVAQFDPKDSGSLGSAVKPPLEVLLMNKNRALQNQIAELSASSDQMQAELHRLKMFEAESRQQAQEQRELIAVLESDLYRLQEAYDEVQRVGPFGQSNSPPTLGVNHVSSHAGGREGQMLAEAIGEDRPNEATASRVDLSLLQIVVHQRDRFRARTEELEQSEANHKQQLVLLQREVESIRADNVKLYGKIRFLQSYSVPTRSQSNQAPSQSVTVPLHQDAVVEKYSRAYEADLDPFNQFHLQERQRHYRDLGPHEKIILKLVRLGVGNRKARLGVFIYALVLHLLVFLALYKAAYFQTTANEAEANCLQKYAEHMRRVHQEAAPKGI